jgi:hypothetical protein
LQINGLQGKGDGIAQGIVAEWPRPKGSGRSPTSPVRRMRPTMMEQVNAQLR